MHTHTHKHTHTQMHTHTTLTSFCVNTVAYIHWYWDVGKHARIHMQMATHAKKSVFLPYIIYVYIFLIFSLWQKCRNSRLLVCVWTRHPKLCVSYYYVSNNYHSISLHKIHSHISHIRLWHLVWYGIFTKYP